MGPSIDYRKLNDLTIDAAQPLPVIHQTLKDLGQANIFSTIDLKSGYWQIPLHPDSRKYTAFATPDGGQYQFRVMPFGLKNAPCIFQNIMKEILGTFWRQFVIAYLDDLIIYSQTEEENLKHLALIFERLEIYGLSCNPKKCHFGKTKLEYLAVIWSVKRYRPYLEDSHFTLRTDSTVQTWLRRMKNEKSKLARWACLLDGFSFTVEHCAGKNNESADALSRHPAPEAPTLERMLLPTREKTGANQENSRPVFNALEQASLFDETHRKIPTRYHWPGMRNSIRRHINSCHLCFCCKPIYTTTRDALRSRAAQTLGNSSARFNGTLPALAYREKIPASDN